jgi:hypothetical protein
MMIQNRARLNQNSVYHYMDESLAFAKVFSRRGAESAEKCSGTGLEISASSAPLRETFIWEAFGCGFAALDLLRLFAAIRIRPSAMQMAAPVDCAFVPHADYLIIDSNFCQALVGNPNPRLTMKRPWSGAHAPRVSGSAPPPATSCFLSTSYGMNGNSRRGRRQPHARARVPQSERCAL